MDHEGLRDLLAVYALDALPAEDAQLVEDHLRDCPRCASELSGFRETAALLAYSGADAPEGVWEAIAAHISGRQEPPKLSLVVGDRRSSDHAMRPWTRRFVAATAAVIIAVLGVAVVHEDRQVDQVRSALGAQQNLEAATVAALDPAARHVVLTAFDGRPVASVAVLPDGRGYVIPVALPVLSDTRTYQLWSIVAGRPVSGGLLGSTPGVFSFHMPPHTSVLAITNEPAGGSRTPTSSPVATGAV